jgi:hypothetical protein
MPPEQKPENTQTNVPVAVAPQIPAENPTVGANPIIEPTKSRPKIFLGIAGAILIVLGFLTGYVFCSKDHDEIAHTHTAANITLPKEATATAECVAGRGKQYILPKDIPMGPIYDVHEGKVVAIEYLVGQKELSEKSDMFASLKLPDGEYDHLAIMPMTAHAGLDETHFHAIAYLISSAESKKIVCSASSDSEMDMSTDSHSH